MYADFASWRLLLVQEQTIGQHRALTNELRKNDETYGNWLGD
jgi:hypothetical protein